MDAALTDLKLLPMPQQVVSAPGGVPVDAKWSLQVKTDDARVSREAERIVRLFTEVPYPAGEQTARVDLQITVDPRGAAGPESYMLTIRRDRIELIGGAAQGCFYGLQTLRQILRLCPNAIPCGVIEDWPDLATRGVLYDVSRGKVPTLATLQGLVDKLANWKMNQLQLYIEHAFVFDFDSSICGPDDGLTPDEVSSLDRYCADRFVQLVPAAATFGHMGRILCLPQYAHLAEIEAGRSWSELSWPQRARGLTLDCLNPDSRKLVERVWSDLMDAFRSPVVNICGDEPWDLGAGKNKHRWDAGEQGVRYLDHVLWTHDLCAKHGRRTQFWSDVVLNYPELFDRIPKDCTVLHWGYDDDCDYEVAARLARAGVSTIVCPGTSGWKRMLGAMTLAEHNITRFVATARAAQATGCIVTDWGDHGHVNPLAASLHAMALAGALSWRHDHPAGKQFDQSFSAQVPECGGATVLSSLRRVSAVIGECETWRLFWISARESCDDPTLPTAALAEELYEAAGDTVRCLEDSQRAGTGSTIEMRELELACTFTQLFARKAQIIRERLDAGCSGEVAGKWTGKSTGQRAGQWAEQVRDSSEAHAAIWRVRNKPSGLSDIRNALTTAADDLVAFTDGRQAPSNAQPASAPPPSPPPTLSNLR